MNTIGRFILLIFQRNGETIVCCVSAKLSVQIPQFSATTQCTAIHLAAHELHMNPKELICSPQPSSLGVAPYHHFAAWVSGIPLPLPVSAACPNPLEWGRMAQPRCQGIQQLEGLGNPGCWHSTVAEHPYGPAGVGMCGMAWRYQHNGEEGKRHMQHASWEGDVAPTTEKLDSPGILKYFLPLPLMKQIC